MNPDKYVTKFSEGKCVKCVDHALDSNQNPTDIQVSDYNTIKELTKQLYDKVETLTISSRYKALALTKLEEFAMFENKAIFHHKEIK